MEKKESPENEEKELVLSKFRKRFKSTFMRLAFAGFLTLGGSMARIFGDQLKIVEKEGGQIEFVMERPLEDTDRYMRELFNREPRLKRWFHDRVNNIKGELNDFSSSLVDELTRYRDNTSVDFQREYAERLLSSSSDIKKIRKTLDFLEDETANILSYVIRLDDSRTTLSSMTRQSNTEINLSSDYLLDSRMDGSARTSGSQININPSTFFYSTNIPDKFSVSESWLVRFMVHEIVHTLHATGSTSHSVNFFNEGVTDSHSLEIMQELQKRNSSVYIMLNDYDTLVISTSVLNSILATSESSKDALLKYSMGRTTKNDLLGTLGERFRALGIRGSDVMDHLSNMDRQGYNSMAFLKKVLDMLPSDLKANISPEFIRAILTQGRKMGWNKEVSEKLERISRETELK